MLSVSEFDVEDDRYSRLRLIPWWDQQLIARSRVLVVGAGALGNEILKNFALLGFRHVVIVDLDRVEISNLSRTVLFRTTDLGKFKAVAAAEAYKELADGAEIKPIIGNVMYDCGLGLFAWADVILAGLDNREARLWINRSAWKVGRPWIDGAIEGINGVARVFASGQPPCYECTLGEVDWAILDRRMSCNLLVNRTDTEGKVPTTPTISSIIAGIQAQEAVKLLHDLPTLAGHGFIFEGMNHTSYKVEYTENPDCMSHYTIPEWVRLPESSDQWTLHDLWRRAQRDLSADVVTVEFSRDVIWRFSCPRCGGIEELFAPVGSVPYERGACSCDRQQRVAETIHNYSGAEAWGGRRLSQLGLPLLDVFVARSGQREIGYIAEGDQMAVLGSVAARESVPA